MVSRPAFPTPESDLKTVVESRNREWHFHIYFLLQSPTETAAALALRDAVLRLRRDGQFCFVPPITEWTHPFFFWMCLFYS